MTLTISHSMMAKAAVNTTKESMIQIQIHRGMDQSFKLMTQKIFVTMMSLYLAVRLTLEEFVFLETMELVIHFYWLILL